MDLEKVKEKPVLDMNGNEIVVGDYVYWVRPGGTKYLVDAICPIDQFVIAFEGNNACGCGISQTSDSCILVEANSDSK